MFRSRKQQLMLRKISEPKRDEISEEQRREKEKDRNSIEVTISRAY
jgi:hypothetical protein